MVVTFQTVPPVLTQAVFNAERQAFCDALNALTSTGIGAGAYTYLIRKSGAVYEAYNSQAALVYGGSADAGGVDGDDAAAVINAAAAALTGIGGTIFIKNGLYDNLTTLLIKENTTVIGESWATILKLKADYANTLLFISNEDNVVLSNFTVDGNRLNQTGGFPHCVQIYDTAANILVDHLKIINSYSVGIDIALSSNITIQNCFIKDCSADGINIETGGVNAYDIKILNNRITEFDRYGINVFQASKVLISSNTIWAGTNAAAPAIDVYSSSDNIIISNNKIYDHVGAAIRVIGTKTTVSANIIDNVTDGVKVYGELNTIGGNEIYNTSGYGIFITSATALKNNVINNSLSTETIYIDDEATNNNIIGNQCDSLFIDADVVKTVVVGNALNTFTDSGIGSVIGSNNLTGSPALSRPQQFNITTPAMPASGVEVTNTFSFPVIIYITDVGTVTAVLMWGSFDSGTTNNIAIGTPSGLIYGQTFYLEPACKISLTYTGAPTWKWYGT